MKKLVTHNQGFHADDVTAYAIIKEVLSRKGETWELTRTRDEAEIETADIVFDVGNIYDPETNRYDHHQKGRAGERENGILYASAGLAWKHFGKELCSNDSVWSQIDRGIISELDAIDNGQNYIGDILFKDAGYTSLAQHISNFKPFTLERTPEILQESFESASEFVREIILRAINSLEYLEREYQEAVSVYNNSINKEILIFEKDYERPTWVRLSEFPEPFFVVYPNKVYGSWKVEAIRKSIETMEPRKPAPESWHGLKDEDFQKVSGVPDATFCHPSGFLFGAISKEGALELAKKALEV